MKSRNIIYWISTAFATLFGIIVIGYGIHLIILGQDCRSYADLGCAFGVVFSFVIIPYGVTTLLLVGLASLPFKPVSLMGSILSILAGIAHFGFCCIITMWPFTNEGFEMLSNTELFYFIFPLFILLTGISLLGMGISGYQSLK